MEDPPCEVIGCKNRSCWMLRYPIDRRCADYLCNTHWEMLRANKPSRASCYAPNILMFDIGAGTESRHGSCAPVSEMPNDSVVVVADWIGRSEQQPRQLERA